MERGLDAAETHYLSESTLASTPLYILEGRRRLEELKMQIKDEEEFLERLTEEGLLETYIKNKR